VLGRCTAQLRVGTARLLINITLLCSK